ncbi:MAG: HD domain-containing protein [Dehalococcoidia bacterium]
MLSGQAGYLVGGSLRDSLLGRRIVDLDLAVGGDAPTFARALARRLDGHFVTLDDERGTSRIVLEDGPVRVIDVAELRGDIETDLGLRDFTVDAIAAPIDEVAVGEDVELIDPHGGLSDIEARVVRLVSEQALVDDPLRLLRAVRLCAQLEFDLAPESADAIRMHAALISEPAAERQRDELARCLATDRAAAALRLMDGLGLLERLLPEITAGRGVTQPKEHHYDVFDHNIEAVAALDFLLGEREPDGAREASFRRELWSALSFDVARAHLALEVSEGRSNKVLLKLATLLHDVAKPETRAPDETGRIRFFGHAERGAETARAIMRRLRFSRRETDLVALMVEEHLRPGQLSQEGAPSRRALYRYFRDTGEAADSILLLTLADAYSAGGPRIDIGRWRGHVAYIAHVLSRRDEDETIARPPRLLTGEDVMAELGIGPGPEVGRLLAEVEEAHAGGEVAGRAAALAFVRRRHASASNVDRLSMPREAVAAPGAAA